MKINIIKPDQPSELQKLITGLPFDAASEAEYKGLMLVEELLVLMKERGINRTQLAKRMGIGSPRVTAMLNGTSNFTLETLIRAAHAVGATLQQTLVPEGTTGRWSVYREDEIHTAFKSRKNHCFTNPPYQLDTDEIATDDDAKSA